MSGTFIHMKSSGPMLCDESESSSKLGKRVEMCWAKRRSVLCVQDDSVDLRQIYLSVAALSRSISFKSLLRCAFNVSPIPTSALRNIVFLLLSGTLSCCLIICAAIWQGRPRQSECRRAVWPHGCAAGCSSAQHWRTLLSGVKQWPPNRRWVVLICDWSGLSWNQSQSDDTHACKQQICSSFKNAANSLRDIPLKGILWYQLQIHSFTSLSLTTQASWNIGLDKNSAELHVDGSSTP